MNQTQTRYVFHVELTEGTYGGGPGIHWTINDEAGLFSCGGWTHTPAWRWLARRAARRAIRQHVRQLERGGNVLERWTVTIERIG